MLPMLPFLAGLIAGAAAVSTLRSSSRPSGAADASGAQPPAASPAPAPEASEAPAGARRVRRQRKGRADKGAGA